MENWENHVKFMENYYKFKNYFVNLHIKFDFRHTISFLSKDYKID